MQLSWIDEARRSSSSATINRDTSRDRRAWGVAGLALIALVGAIAMVVNTRRASETPADPVQFAIFPPISSAIALLCRRSRRNLQLNRKRTWGNIFPITGHGCNRMAIPMRAKMIPGRIGQTL